MTMIRNRAVIQGITGLPGLFTAYFEASATPTTAERTEAAARVRAFFAALSGNIPNTCSIAFSGNSDDINPADGTLTGGGAGSVPVLITGGSAGDMLPLGLCLEAKYLSNVIIRGRRVRGHSFVGPFTELVNTVGLPTAGLQTAVLNGAIALGTTIVTPLAHVIWSRPVKDPVTHAIVHTGASCGVNSYDVATTFTMLRSRRS